MNTSQVNIEFAQGFRVEKNKGVTREEQMSAISLLSNMAGTMSNTHAALVGGSIPNEVMAANLSYAATVLNSIVCQISDMEMGEWDY